MDPRRLPGAGGPFPRGDSGSVGSFDGGGSSSPTAGQPLLALDSHFDMGVALDRLEQLGYQLPEVLPPRFAYLPTRLVPIGEGRSLLHISGQVSRREGRPITGRTPDEIGIEEARAAARSCGLQLLAQIEAACGLDAIEQVAQLTGFVNCAPGFTEQSAVIDGASELLVEVLGEAGRHTRIAVGANALPGGHAVEIAAVVVVRR
jgi:enamine deaminase RidA (YjgF/YER057c/UK114 family)